MQDVNHPAVITASMLILVLGAVWYSPLLFYKAWIRENSLSEEEIKNQNSIKVYGLTVVLSILMSYNLAFFLAGPETDLLWGVSAGFLTGFWGASIFTVIALFEIKSWKYILINCGFILTYFTLVGLILGAWR